MHGRFPDFVIVGTMKSGTTSLFRWLGAQPGVVLPSVKEPGYFAETDPRPDALDRYRRLFGAAGDAVTGEASVIYTAPDRAAGTARRLAAAVPDARLLCVVRHPIHRLRSHYRHEVQRGREKRSLTVAATPSSPYATWSGYGTCVGPWVDSAGARLLVVRFEDLVGPDESAWSAVLSHLGLPRGPRPHDGHNTTADKKVFTPVMRRLYDAGIRRAPSGAPKVLRRIAKRALLRDRAVDDGGQVPAEVRASIWRDVAALETRLGTGELWPRDDDD